MILVERFNLFLTGIMAIIFIDINDHNDNESNVRLNLILVYFAR